MNGYAILSTFTQAAVVVGPALAGGLAALVGPGWVIGADAVSFAVLAVICWAASPRPAAASSAAPAAATRSWRIIAGQPRLLGLLAVTGIFFFLYGPVEVALPVHVAQELPRLRRPAGPVLGRVRRRRHAGRPRRGPAPAPFTVARGGEHRHRMGSRAAPLGVTTRSDPDWPGSRSGD